MIKVASIKMPADIEGIVRNVLLSNNDSTIVEIEVRFQGFFRTRIFHDYLLRMYAGTVIGPEYSEVTGYRNNLRTVTINGLSSVWRKDALYTQKEYRYSFNISSEHEISQEIGLDDPIMKRKRVRYYAPLSDNVSLVLTRINDSDYEIEIESELTRDSLPDLSASIKEFFATFDNFFADIAETYHEVFRDFLEKFNKNLNAATGKIDPHVLARPRDFTVKDLTTYQRYNNDTIAAGRGIDTGYTITVKGDGLNTVVFIYKGRYLCLVRPTQEYFYIVTNRLEGYGPYTSIYVGEDTMGQNSSTLFTVFDILFDSRSPGLPTLRNHLERLELAKQHSRTFVNTVNQSSNRRFYFKEFYPIGATPESFAVAYKKATKDAASQSFGSDGFILTPIYTLHNPIDKKVPGKRVLGKQADLCKIKPVEELTIDFVPAKDHQVIASNPTTIFQGTKRFSFDPEVNVDWGSVPDEYYDQVCEFKPTFVQTGEQDDGLQVVLVFKKHRSDKVTPNTIKIASNVWDSINDPVSEKVFLNEDFTRHRRQNNTVKRELISMYPDQCIIIDIGSGRGGDIDKYRNKAVKVICVEPDAKNRAELEKRLTRMDSDIDRQKFIVLATGGEDSQTIMDIYLSVKKQFPSAQTVISCMLSLTFFWKSKTFLNRFLELASAVASFSADTKFGFLTIDGRRMLEYLRENSTVKDGIVKLREKAIQADYDANYKGGISIPGRVKIAISGTIVRPQYEYLVNLNDMSPEITIDWTKDAIVERYLSQKEKKYAMTHIYGIGTINGNHGISKMLRYTGLPVAEAPFSGSQGLLEFENIGNNYYRIVSTDETKIQLGDPIANFLIVALNGFETDPVKYREFFYNEFIEALSQPDPRYPGRKVKDLYSGNDPQVLFPSSDQISDGSPLPMNARIYTLSRGRFQDEFFTKSNASSLKNRSLLDIVIEQIDSERPPVSLYLMIADYLELSMQLIDGLSDLVDSHPLFEESWISLPKSRWTVLFITDPDTDLIYPVGERGLDGKIVTRFVN